jgi:hypothetical protein
LIVKANIPSTSHSTLRNLWEGWKRVAQKIGDVQARIILTLFYIFAVGPFALPIRWFGDPLTIKKGSRKGWSSRANPEPVSIERATQQF